MQVIAWDGLPISKPGIYSGIPNAAYHAQLTVGPSISTSGLKKIFFGSVAHWFEESYLNPANWEEIDGVKRLKEKPTTEPLLFGRGAHHLLLGEANFAGHFAIQPATYVDAKGDEKPWNNNATACREWHKWVKDGGRAALTQAQIEAIRGMAAGLAANPLVRSGILNGLIEHSFVWQDEITGIWLKWRPDAVPTDSLDFGDLKSAADITDDGIENAIGRDGLNMQGGMGAMACAALLDRQMATFSLVFSEKTPPHVARVKTLKPADIDTGVTQCRAALSLLQRALERSTWSGPGGEQSDADYAEMKPYHRTAIERRLAAIQQELSL